MQLHDTNITEESRRDGFVNGETPVAVYGLGKIGLPLAAVYAETTGNVIGVDIDPAVVESIRSGECPIENEPGLPELVSDLVDDGSLRVTTNPAAAAREATLHVVIVPTLLNGTTVDLSAIEAAVDSIAEGLAPGDMVVVESTLPPGTTAEVIRPRLASGSGLSPDEFGLAFCPERTSSGRALKDIRGAYPKVVGGVDPESTRVARLVYGELTTNDVLTCPDSTAAECVKLFEGLYRDVNIALANEIARIGAALGTDARFAIETANTQPYCEIHDPGPGVGGHCIPYYPYFVMNQVDIDTPLLQTARDVNDSMPTFVVDRLDEELSAVGRTLDGARVLVLGVTYRPGVAETRATPAGPIIEQLGERGATVLAADPMLEPEEIATYGAEPTTVETLPKTGLDAAVVVTPHREFDDIDWRSFDPLVLFDGRDTIDIEESDHRIHTLGRGTRTPGRFAQEATLGDR